MSLLQVAGDVLSDQALRLQGVSKQGLGVRRGWESGLMSGVAEVSRLPLVPGALGTSAPQAGPLPGCPASSSGRHGQQGP